MELKTIEIEIVRKTDNESYITGVMSVENHSFNIREEKKCIIPCGRYRVLMDAYSSIFGDQRCWRELTGGFVPKVINVPGFSEVYIASYNENIHPSITLGQFYSVSSQLLSSEYADFFRIIKKYHSTGHDIWLTVH